MINRMNLYILKQFLFSFVITFLIFAALLFIGDFVEQFRKSTGKNVPMNIIFQLAAFNFLNLISFTLPITSFFGSLMALLILIRNSETIVLNSAGQSIFKTIIPAVLLYFLIGVIFVTLINPLIAIFEKKYVELEYKYIDKVDKFASITKNGLWLKQENLEKNMFSVLYAKSIKNQGEELAEFMVLEYDETGVFQGRLDGKKAILKDGFWEMEGTQLTPKYGSSEYQEKYIYQTNVKLKDISDSLSSPSSISIWRLVTFINFLEELGYSAIDFKMYFYNLLCLPFFIASLVLLSSTITINLKQNDNFTKTIIYSVIIIFILYFLTNLFDALGSTSQIHPITAKLIMPIIVISFSILLQQFIEFKRKKQI